MGFRYHSWFSGPICAVQGVQNFLYVLERNVEKVRELEEIRSQEVEAEE